MDYNGDGYLVEDELLSISKWAFGATPKQAQQTWDKMKETMDTNRDNKISREEYSNYWLHETRSKIQDDGAFVPSYRQFLLKKLAKLEIGKRKQQQIQCWNTHYYNNKSGGNGGDEDRLPRISFHVDDDDEEGG
jgi:hypothetical protein